MSVVLHIKVKIVKKSSFFSLSLQGGGVDIFGIKGEQGILGFPGSRVKNLF